MPAGQELEGMQNVSTVDAPGRMVMLYHWSLVQEQETALETSDISASLSMYWENRTRKMNRKGLTTDNSRLSPR